uniref:C3H1-type domain-containing protein n=1 Tax=Eutreptiella gymnastica TaxID=73025 RepID=A0A7S4LM75_9EUGL|mmetsp:Transcript_26676/g.45350  ORF Transcript_26676/g.45350 Transcript_26676/m.45350 type:complete len:239 (+) Transcript_26676:26-742(+)
MFGYPYTCTTGRAEVCKDNLHGKCTRGDTCRFTHEQMAANHPNFPPASYPAFPGIPGMPKLDRCRDWVHGKCARESCRFLHTNLSLEQLDFCKDNLAGKCTRETCKFYHGTQEQWQCQQAVLNAHQFYQHLTLLGPSMYAPRMPPSSGAMTNVTNIIPNHLCRDFVRGKCERPGCKFVHEDPNASKAAASETGLIPPGVCRDFVRGKCTRTDCKFSHTEEEGKDAANRNGQMQRYTPY